jgi:hypothetical protein
MVLHLHNEARTAYLFQCSGDNELFAVSHDLTGANIPRTTCTHGWMLRDKFQIGTDEPASALIMPEPTLRGILALGYYIWRDPCWSQRTAQ